MSLNSKRSSSNRSSDNNTNKRKKQKISANQKTLGVVWGSNSPKSPFSDVGSYMTEKNRKLHNQFNAEASTSSFSGSTSQNPIFAGVSIFVDGFTVPSSQVISYFTCFFFFNHSIYFNNLTLIATNYVLGTAGLHVKVWWKI
jgi:DNA repair protein REV1